MQPKDHTQDLEGAAAHASTEAGSVDAARVIDDAEPPPTPRAPGPGRTMHVLATPIISVATKPRVEPSEHTESDDDASSSGVHASAAAAASATPVASVMPAEGLLGLRSGMRPIQANGTLPGFGKADDRRQLAYVHFEPTEGNDVRPEPPAGIVEGVTFVEPRAASLIFALCCIAVIFAVLLVCHRKRWILKL